MPNHLNKSELFSSYPGEFLQRGGLKSDLTSDSAFNSSQSFSSSATNSQVMGSHMENSQSSSFDLFSQMMSQQQGYSQQNESTSSNFYMKYMSKPPLFQKDGASKKTSLPRRKSFQGMQEFNREKAKERDDRDLINTFIAIVKDCADEVKHAASSIKKDVDSNITETTSRTAEVMGKIANELALHHKQLLNSLKTREDHEAKIKDLMETIASKDAKIQLLESQLTTAKSDRNEHLLKTMLDMYTEQQSVTRQHLDKVHEEQQSIKDQQSMLLKETEKSHATLNRITSAAQTKGGDSKRMFQLERDIHVNHSTSSSVPPISVGTTFTKSRYMPGIGQCDGIEQSRVTPMQTNTNPCQVTGQLQVNQMNVPNPIQGQVQNLYPSSSQCGVSDDVVPRTKRNRMSLNTSSQLFQHPPASYQNHHQDISSGVYAMQPVMRPGSLYQLQGSSHPLPHYIEQTGSIRNPLQDHQNLATSTRYPTGKRPSCYNHFNNKFSSPNYTSSDQLWSKKNLKPSPVATIAPQAHCVQTYGDGSQDTQVVSRTKKQSSQKRPRKGEAECHQPQRKSARLSARNSPGNGFCSLREESREEDRPSKRKSKPRKRGRSHFVAQSAKENESQVDESESGGEMIPTYLEQKFPSAKRSAVQNNKPMKKQPTRLKQGKSHSTIPSTSTRNMSDIQNDSSDEDDEYTFHDDQENPPSTTFKAVHTLKGSTSCGDKVKHEQQEVFTKRSVITYSTPNGMKEKYTSAQGSICNDRQMNNATLGRQNAKDNSWQGRGVSGQYNNPVTLYQDADILDTIKTYTQSEEEESSQEIQFSLILPDHLGDPSYLSLWNDIRHELSCLELQRKKNPAPAHWSSVTSPSVNSRYSEQVVPNKPQTKRSSQNLTSTRKRRMIYGSRDNLRKSMAQLITHI